MTQRRARGLLAIAAMLDGVTSAVRRRRGRLPATLFACWRDVVGADLAAQCCPERYQRIGDGGTLVIRVEGPLALELQHLQPQLIERLNVYLGYRAVSRIALRQGTMRPPPARPRSGTPIAEEHFADLDVVDDPALRAALDGLRRGMNRRRAAATMAR